MSVTEPAPAAPAVAADRRLWMGAAVLTVAALMDMLDGTVVNVALPTIQAHMHASGTAVQWVVSGYMLAFAAVLISAGRLGDLIGRRRVFLTGVAAFGATSLLSGLSQSATELVVCRIAQGASAAILMPQVLATFRTAFTGKDRVTAFGIFGAVSGLAAAVGVILGGVITQADLFGLSWRAVFIVNVPLALVILLAGARLVPESCEQRELRFDTTGAVVLAAGLVAIVYPLLEGRQHGWPWWCFVLLAGGIAAVLSLGAIEGRSRHRRVASLINPQQFRFPAFSAGVLVQLLFSLGLQGFSLTFILWLQLGHHFSPLHAGLSMVAFSIGAIITAPGAGGLALRHGRRVLVAGGVLMALGTVAMAVPAWMHHEHITTWLLVPGFLIAGAGLGLLVVPLVNVVLAAVPADVAGGASGVFSTCQQLGGAIGIAVVGSVFFAHLGHGGYTAAFKAAVPVTVAAYLGCAVLAGLLPRHAVSEEQALVAL